ncbi:EamA family transporter [Edaphovirga cremea]|uniref:EamA family transporter n=1 Tax=Edaphovirga cremea TaxID=2267246 RepID=UPI000DEF0405|nr:EamA family transporter [Edaphovirga cremea]
MTYLVALLCVIGIATGQILFKLSATIMHKMGSIYAPRGLVILFLALLLYGVTTLAWVWVLQKMALGKAYPLMALAFILVPIGSYFVFGERFHIQYVIGVVMIIFGIYLVLSRQ